MYEKILKRIADVIISISAITLLLPVFLVLMFIGTIIMHGNPFFCQLRPGKNEKIFRLIKFRTMTNDKDENGNLLPDKDRLVSYGKFLRGTSLDELPELFNILKGDMALVGPRPLLIKDMVFMTPEQRQRHSVRPGLTGLAQCNGRNCITWEKKLEYDLEYIKNITLKNDIGIIFKTAVSVLKREGINEEGMATAMDLGDYLLQNGQVVQDEYDRLQKEASVLYSEFNKK